MNENCAGLDVHQELIVACSLNGKASTARPKKEIESFKTTQKGLLELSEWLKERNCTVVAMESTGVYWKPVWHILSEAGFELILANPRMIKNVPGKKTDMKDAEWIAKLTRVGSVPKSHVPPEKIQNLRYLTRERTSLKHELSKYKNTAHKILQCGGIKITTYISDIFGVSGRRLIYTLIEGEVLTVERIIKLVHGSMKKKVPDLIDALNGFLTREHREQLSRMMRHIKHFESMIKEVEEKILEETGEFKEIKESLKKFRELVR